MLTVFTKSSIFDVLIFDEHVPDYLWYSIIINRACYFESSENHFNLISVLLNYLEQKFMSETCSNLTMKNHNGVDKVILVSFLLPWNFVTCGSTVSTSDNDQFNVGEKDTDPLKRREWKLEKESCRGSF